MKPGFPLIDLTTSYRVSRDLTRHHAKSFYFSSHTLPRAKREAAYALYAFCRHVDDAVDQAPSAAQLQLVLIDLHREVAARRFDHPWGAAFLHTVEQYQIPWEYFQELLNGVGMDQGRVRIQTWEELDLYCYRVASVVGLMMTHVFTRPTDELLRFARDLGTAMQLTNILRDVAEDWSMDRIYLPAEEMRTFGVTEEKIADAVLDPAMREFLRFQIDRARKFYRQSEAGIRLLPRDGSQVTVWMMLEIYAAILEEIEKVDLQIFHQRVRTSLWRKSQLAWKAWGRSRDPDP